MTHFQFRPGIENMLEILKILLILSGLMLFNSTEFKKHLLSLVKLEPGTLKG